MPVIIAKIYREIVAQRLEEKAAGNTLVANSLKIVINSFFGKSSNQYSALYDPRVMVSTTVMRQVLLLWLIAVLEDADIRVISAKTDGIVVKVPVDLESEVVDTLTLLRT